MEEAFEKLKENKKNSVDNLLKWMKDSKIIEDTKAAEEKARALFSDVKDKGDVKLEAFKGALTKMAEEQKQSLDVFTKQLSEEGLRFTNALTAGLTSAATAGVAAFNDALKNK